MATLQDDLDNFLASNYEIEPSREGFAVTDVRTADWCLRKIAKIRGEKQAVKELADEQIERIQAWHHNEIEKLDKNESFFFSLLNEYHGRLIAEDPKKKTINLPNGKLQFRAQQDELTYHPEKLLNQLKLMERKDLIRIKEEIDKMALKEAVIKYGEVIEGVTREARPAKFSVTVGGAE